MYLLQNVKISSGVHPDSGVQGVTEVPLSPKIKQLGREVDYSSLPRAEVKNEWSYMSASPHTFKAWTDTTSPSLPPRYDKNVLPRFSLPSPATWSVDTFFKIVLLCKDYLH